MSGPSRVRKAVEADISDLLPLMRAAATEAARRGCAAVKWQVARWNADGRRFYERLGAVADGVWVDYGVTGAALQALAREEGTS